MEIGVVVTGEEIYMWSEFQQGVILGVSKFIGVRSLQSTAT